MPTIVATTLIDKLRERQDKEELSDQKFGGKLGISKQLWQMIRTGERQIPCPVILKGIAKAYPELVPDVLIFLGFDVELSSLPDSILSKPYQTAQNGFLGVFWQLLIHPYLCYRFIRYKLFTKSKSAG